MITRIREVRKAKHMTLHQVAAACQPPTTAQTIGRLETGMRTVSVGWLNRIAAALGVAAADLVTLPDRIDVPVAAMLTAEGAIAPRRTTALLPPVPGGNIVGVMVEAAQGDYRAGDQLWRARVPLVLGPQTIGPFNTRRGTVLARRSLTSAALVMARDAVSAAQSARVGRAVDLLTTDVVFALDAPPAGSERRDVIVNPSGLLWAENPHVDAAGYRQLLLDLCRSLRAAGRTVHLLAHVIDSPLSDNDVPVARELAALLGGDTEVLVPTSLAEVRTMIASSAVVIGSRMHACLNALSVGVPAIPLAYSRKFDPLLANIGCASTVDLRQSTPAEQLRAVLAELDRPDPRGAAGLIRDRAQEMLSTAQQRLRRLGDSSVGLHHG